MQGKILNAEYYSLTRGLLIGAFLPLFLFTFFDMAAVVDTNKHMLYHLYIKYKKGDSA